MSKKKKKVTAPLTYNPGKGRPKEYLAYLNYQEMQALKRLNGNNQERGPRGLPSFPPAGAMSGGSAKSPASTSKEAGAGSRPSSGGPRSGERGSVSPSSGSSRGSNPPGGGGSDSGNRPSGGMMGGTGSGGSSRTTPSRASSDREAIDAANKANSKIAKTTPALKSDLSRSVSAKPMGASVGVNFPTGGKISGAIKSLQTPAAPLNQSVSRGVTVPTATIPSYSSQELINRAKAVSRGPGVLAAPRQERIARTVAFSESVPGLRQPEMASQLQKAALSGNDLFEYKNATPEQKALMDRISSTGLHVSMKTGLDPRLVLGQALHESTTSKNKTRVSQLARDYNNLFGVKATGKPKEWDGVTTWSGASSTMPTGEYYGPTQKMYNEGFRVYDTPEQSLMDYGRLIEGKYGAAGKFDSIAEQAKAIKAGGYATDPKYAKALTKSANRVSVTPDGVVAPATSSSAESAGLMSLIPDAVKIGVAKNYAKKVGKDLAGYYKQGIEGLQGYFGADAETPTEAVKTGSKIVNLEPGDVYGPKYVAPEVQEVMRKQGKLNKAGISGMKRVPGFGAVVSAGDALTKLFTGDTIAGSSADLKREYMQASDEGKAALEDEYPNLTKFASDAGLTPKRDMSNYTNWAEKSGLRVAPDRRGGGESSGILSLTRQPKGDETTTPEPEAPSTSSGSRPDIYYMWDLGVNVPSPGDPNYTQYQTYLAERLAAQRAMGYV